MEGLMQPDPLTNKIKVMKSTGAIQTVAILLLVASAASCEVAKEYSSRVFKPTTPQKTTDSNATTLKFMHFDNEKASDSVDLKEFVNKETGENDKPALLKDTTKTDAMVDNKPVPKQQPVDASKRGTTRTKRVRQ